MNENKHGSRKLPGEVRYKYKKIIQILRPQKWRKVKKQNNSMI